MNLKFYANACCSYTSQGKTLLCDPWLVDGAFDGAWFHWPPLKTKPQDVLNADYLYLSHIHPDHFDLETLKHLRRDIPVIILNHGLIYLSKLVEKQGFTNVIKINDMETKEIGPFKVTMYAPFIGNSFHETEFGNPLDSAIIVQADGKTVFNTNDNTPTLEVAKSILQRFKGIDVAQLNYNAAGPYPSCFSNLSDDEKLREHGRILSRNLWHMTDLAKALKPALIMPFAGQYVIGGKNWRKNEFLGTTSMAVVARFLRKNKIDTLIFDEGATYHLDSGIMDRINRLDPIPQDEYIEKLSDKKYSYESDPDKEPPVNALLEAKGRLFAMKNKLNIHPDCRISIEWESNSFEFDLSAEKSAKVLRCKMDKRLLNRILWRQSHWNNAEIGCHIEFFREPNVYQPDVHMLMSYFHV